ncbi:MAG: hypothetical protein ACI3VX_00735, partial [Faecousia sp.]
GLLRPHALLRLFQRHLIASAKKSTIFPPLFSQTAALFCRQTAGTPSRSGGLVFFVGIALFLLTLPWGYDKLQSIKLN